MELFGLVLGLIFWPTVIAVWLRRSRARQMSAKMRWGGLAAILTLPTLGLFASLRWSLVDEPLLSAAGSGSVSRVNELLAQGANVNVESDGGTPLGYAVMHGKTEVVSILLAHGADPNHSIFDRQSPLAAARSGHYPKIVALLQKAGAKE